MKTKPQIPEYLQPYIDCFRIAGSPFLNEELTDYAILSHRCQYSAPMAQHIRKHTCEMTESLDMEVTYNLIENLAAEIAEMNPDANKLFQTVYTEEEEALADALGEWEDKLGDNNDY